nr:uncharacterized protein LOC129385575 isoform X3 [Dermacentor andersoni]
MVGDHRRQRLQCPAMMSASLLQDLEATRILVVLSLPALQTSTRATHDSGAETGQLVWGGVDHRYSIPVRHLLEILANPVKLLEQSFPH